MIKVDLSIVMVNYNTKDLTLQAVESIEKNYPKEVAEGSIEVILVDNASPDNSLQAFKEYKNNALIKTLYVVGNQENIGFAAGSNRGVAYAKGRYVLFLNPDTVTYSQTLTHLIDFMDQHPSADAVTCRVETPAGELEEACHRGLPTPWNAFCHFTKLESLFPKSRVFAGYIQGWKDLTKTHRVDAILGAFLFVRREVGEEVNWWDEDYFFYGEDLQFCYNMRRKGYRTYFVPEVGILHYGGVSSGIKKRSEELTTADTETKRNAQNWRFDAMRIFYHKNYATTYSKFVTWAVSQGINFLHKRPPPSR